MLTTTDLKAGYNGNAVVELPDLTLQKGESCLLRGRSGSGKTTILHTIAGMTVPVSGTIKLNDQDIYVLSESERDQLRGQKMGIIFQTLHLIKSLSVLDNLLLAPCMAGAVQNRERAYQLLDKLEIKDLAGKQAIAISQGQAQRVAIARALFNSPALILADEPTSSLDDQSCQQTIDLLLTLSREAGAILIVSSHDARLSSSFDQTVTVGI